VVAVSAIAAPLYAQEGTWVNTRFERIHLRNGNAIDGHLIQESNSLIVLEIPGGQMRIRKDSIDSDGAGRLRIELIKMRSYQEAPKLLPVLRPKASPPAESAPKSAPSAAPEVQPESVSLTGTPEEQLEQAEGLLKSASKERQRGVIDSLQKLGSSAAPVIARHLSDLDDSVVPSASQALQTLKDPSVVKAVHSLLSSDRAAVREAAVSVIGALGNGKEDAADVRPLLSDSDIRVRGATIIALRRLGDTESFDRIADFISDPDSELRTKAMLALTELAQSGGLSKKLTEVLGRSIERANGQIRIELLGEAAKLGALELGPIFSRLATDPEPMVRSYAIMGLGKINSTEYEEQILERLGVERDYWPRIQLAEAAKSMKLKKAVDPLIDWLGDEDGNIRAAAYRSLQAITGLNFGSGQEEWRAWRAAQK
jgi:HEAT repeat protein